MDTYMMNLKNKKIGIWGYGVVGKSVSTFLHAQGYTLEVMNKQELTKSQQEELVAKKINFCTQGDHPAFFERNDYIIPSPGIDLRPYYHKYQNKWISELDLFSAYFKKPIIGITGSVGKTTITHALSDILSQYGKRVSAGGNIGTACLDLVAKQTSIDSAVLELSSFQLAYIQTFAPDLAIWTNIHPNHLDWHNSMEDYFDAKLNILAHQKPHQRALVPLELRKDILKKNIVTNTLHYFSKDAPSKTDLEQLQPDSTLFYIDNNTVTLYKNGDIQSLIELSMLPPITFTQNWLIICGALALLGYDLNQLPAAAQNIQLPEHRLEKISNPHGFDIYNDSKATTTAATLAAVEQFKNRPIILLLGGLSKGADRSDLIKQIAGTVKYVYCFGQEAQLLHTLCAQHSIPSCAYNTLEETVTTCLHNSSLGDVILFSPSGSSFDLFKNYEDRGAQFKAMVKKYFPST
jgi:UDP-N-acetylmuramoylalanine--D-glutamate ligase